MNQLLFLKKSSCSLLLFALRLKLDATHCGDFKGLLEAGFSLGS